MMTEEWCPWVWHRLRRGGIPSRRTPGSRRCDIAHLYCMTWRISSMNLSFEWRSADLGRSWENKRCQAEKEPREIEISTYFVQRSAIESNAQRCASRAGKIVPLLTCRNEGLQMIDVQGDFPFPGIHFAFIAMLSLSFSDT